MLSIMASDLRCFSLILRLCAKRLCFARWSYAPSVLPLVLVCAISDVVLIAAGVAGFGVLVQAISIVDYLRYFGAAFLVVYGLRAFLSAAWSAMERGG